MLPKSPRKLPFKSARHLVPIPYEVLKGMTGQPVHLKWASPRAYWIVARVSKQKLYLVTPKTAKSFTAHTSDALYM